ncbi:unnamed protein product [Ixodes persulcatus]
MECFVRPLSAATKRRMISSESTPKKTSSWPAPPAWSMRANTPPSRSSTSEENPTRSPLMRRLPRTPSRGLYTTYQNTTVRRISQEAVSIRRIPRFCKHDDWAGQIRQSSSSKAPRYRIMFTTAAPNADALYRRSGTNCATGAAGSAIARTSAQHPTKRSARSAAPKQRPKFINVTPSAHFVAGNIRPATKSADSVSRLPSFSISGSGKSSRDRTTVDDHKTAQATQPRRRPYSRNTNPAETRPASAVDRPPSHASRSMSDRADGT